MWYIITACGWSKGRKTLLSVVLPPPSGIDPLNFSYENSGKFLPGFFLHFCLLSSFFRIMSPLLPMANRHVSLVVTSRHCYSVDDFRQWGHQRWTCWLMWGYQCHHLPRRSLCLLTFSSHELKLFTKWFFWFSFFIYFSRFPSSEFAMSS